LGLNELRRFGGQKEQKEMAWQSQDFFRICDFAKESVRTFFAASAFLSKPVTLEELVGLMKLLVDFWMACEVPQVDISGRRLETQARGKLGERFSR
jgi:hypothetical protein